MKLSALLVLGTIFSQTAAAAIITVTLTGTTGEIRIGEGPIFGHRSYSVIPPGDPFQLTYRFDEAKGDQKISEADERLILQSQIENTAHSSPGVSATLQINGAVWEFGVAAHAQVVLKTSAANRSEQFAYITSASSNRVSVNIVPGKGSYWPRNGDWRASFNAGPLDGSTATFSADNDRVSAKGSLNPSSITVTGIDIGGQWLQLANSQAGERHWKLAHASAQGGCIVEQVTRTIRGVDAEGAPLTPSFVRYWQAWLVPAGSDAPAKSTDAFPEPMQGGSTGQESVSTVARFYDGLKLPPSFAAGNSPYAGDQLASTVDPHLPTDSATLPVEANFTVHFGAAQSPVEAH